MEHSYIKEILLNEIREAKKRKVPLTTIAEEIGVKYDTINRWRTSKDFSPVLVNKLIKYFNLKLVKIL